MLTSWLLCLKSASIQNLGIHCLGLEINILTMNSIEENKLVVKMEHFSLSHTNERMRSQASMGCFPPMLECLL